MAVVFTPPLASSSSVVHPLLTKRFFSPPPTLALQRAHSMGNIAHLATEGSGGREEGIKNHALLLQTKYTSFGFYWALLFIPAYKFFAFYMEGPWAAMTTTSIFLAVVVTDWLDGYIARKMQLGTPFGAFLDNSNKYRHCRSSADIARASFTIPVSVSMSSSGSIGPSRIDRAAAASGRSGHRRTRRTGPPWTLSTTTTKSRR
ncbi:Cardiolipin synthase (CMP-forming), mitochondrial [Zea mays]|uniref:Cardiolipin synthase (CMP-forming), mitochondrial n=1 Tax=Zea mays TaxID=4577 RepID=A0A3L6FKK4_MAIZE|nr:Cardiolipin synthase (CMP-forming), mitochondrial [Zea mays]